MPLIYLITNRINGKRYVGQTVWNLSRRWYQHQYTMSRGGTFALSNAIRKYGSDAFTIEELETCEKEALNAREIHYISFLNTTVPGGYNITKGGHDNGRKGHSHSEDVKRRIGDGNRGKIVSEETKAKMRGRKRPDLALSNKLHPRQSWVGRKHTEESKALISQKMMGHKRCVGRIVSDATREKIRQSLLARNREVQIA